MEVQVGVKRRGDEATDVEAGGVFRCFASGERGEVVMEVSGIKLYSCQWTPICVTGRTQ